MRRRSDRFPVIIDDFRGNQVPWSRDGNRTLYRGEVDEPTRRYERIRLEVVDDDGEGEDLVLFTISIRGDWNEDTVTAAVLADNGCCLHRSCCRAQPQPEFWYNAQQNGKDHDERADVFFAAHFSSGMCSGAHLRKMIWQMQERKKK